jgi:uncharacterized protein (UPF0332 family)
MNRIYYSGFYIVSALALFDDFSTSKHKQLIGCFKREYIKTNKIEQKIGDFFEKAYENRIVTDYHDFVYLTKTEIQEYYLGMQTFIEEVDKIIQSKMKNS